MTDSSNLNTLAILDGISKEGKGQSYRWARAGYRLLIRSSSTQKAKAVLQEIPDMLGITLVEGMENTQTEQSVSIVILTVPYSVHHIMLIQNKI